MRITNKFAGKEPESIPEIHMDIMEAYDRLPDHWKNLVTIDQVILTDMNKPDFSQNCDVVTPTTIVLTDLKPDIGWRTDTKSYFVFGFLGIFLNVYPGFQSVVEEQAKGRRISVVGISSGITVVLSPVQCFRLAFPYYLFYRDNLDQASYSFLARCDQMVKYGHLSI